MWDTLSLDARLNMKTFAVSYLVVHISCHRKVIGILLMFGLTILR